MTQQRNTYNSWDEVEKQIAEGGGGGGDVTKEYVDQQDAALSQRIADNTTNIANLDTSKADRTEVQNKLDKLTDEGEFVYSHNGDVQTSKGFEVADEPSGSAAHVASSKTVKAVKTSLDNAKANKATSLSGYGITDAYTKTEVDTELAEKIGGWEYVGILSASHGSILNVKDDWTELLIVMRIMEGSSTYNITNVIPKRGFTEGNPTGNQSFAGFYWNESYKATARLGLEGSGDSRNLKLNYTQAIGWTISGFYILKR